MDNEISPSVQNEMQAAKFEGPLCRDCVFCKPDRTAWWFCLCLPLAPIFAWLAYRHQYEFATCKAAPKIDGDSLIGIPRYKRRFYFCSTERGFDCGKTGKHFRAKAGAA